MRLCYIQKMATVNLNIDSHGPYDHKIGRLSKLVFRFYLFLVSRISKKCPPTIGKDGNFEISI